MGRVWCRKKALYKDEKKAFDAVTCITAVLRRGHEVRRDMRSVLGQLGHS